MPSRVHDRYCRCRHCTPPRDYIEGSFPPPAEMSVWRVALFSVAVALSFCALIYCVTL